MRGADGGDGEQQLGALGHAVEEEAEDEREDEEAQVAHHKTERDARVVDAEKVAKVLERRPDHLEVERVGDPRHNEQHGLEPSIAGRVLLCLALEDQLLVQARLHVVCVSVCLCLSKARSKVVVVVLVVVGVARRLMR